MWWNHDIGGASWLLMLIGMTGFWAVIAVLVLTLARQDQRQGPQADARQILEARLARGELDVDEYLERLSVLDQMHS